VQLTSLRFRIIAVNGCDHEERAQPRKLRCAGADGAGAAVNDSRKFKRLRHQTEASHSRKHLSSAS